MYSTLRRYSQVGIVAGIIALILFAYCSGKSAGSVKVEDKELQHRVERAEKAAKIAIQSADREKKRGDSLTRKLNYADSLVQFRTQKYTGAREAYRNLRDSIHDVPPIVIAADSALAQADSALKAHEAKDVVQDSVIASQSRQIFSLREALDWRAEEISALNKRLALSTKRVRSARKDGLLLGIGATAFAVVVTQALK